LEVKMAITRRTDRRKGIRRQSDRRKGDMKRIKIEGESDKGKEVTVGHEAIPEKKAGSVWSLQKEFAVEWSETFLTKKRKKHPRKGE
jgi:hypothetical protein